MHLPASSLAFSTFDRTCDVSATAGEVSPPISGSASCSFSFFFFTQHESSLSARIQHSLISNMAPKITVHWCVPALLHHRSTAHAQLTELSLPLRLCRLDDSRSQRILWLLEEVSLLSLTLLRLCCIWHTSTWLPAMTQLLSPTFSNPVY